MFEIAKNASTATLVATFTGASGPGLGIGSGPTGNLIADANGNLFGTTLSGGTANDGTVFEIAKTPGSTPTTLVSLYRRQRGKSGR